jgi:hypothetical protein
MDYQKIYFYDIESFPSFSCATFLDKDTQEVIQFSFGCGHNDLQNLKEFCSQKALFVGFNNISYDDPALRFILEQPVGVGLPKKLFTLSKRLVSDTNRRDEDIVKLRYPRDTYCPWDSMDLFKIMHFDRLGVGLKQCAINLKHERIQDLPYPYDHLISTKDEVKTVLEYNINDVLITQKLFNQIQPQIKLREEIGNLYNVNVMNASDSKMGNIILEHYYKEELGIDVRTLKDLRTKRSSVDLKDCIPAVISFQTPDLISFHEKIKNTTVVGYENFKFEEVIKYKGTRYSIGSGGIHSMESACRFDETSDKKIISCDIASMYPTCIILNNIYPEHLDERFVKILGILTAERLAAKSDNPTKADALKITINGLYGKLNSDTFWLEDAKAMLSVTIAGQLYILMLVEMLELNGVHCISANTDGIECEVPVEKEGLYYETCKRWEEKTGFTLEFVEYKSYIKRDVNNYIAIGSKKAWLTGNWKTANRDSGKVKTKGAFIPDIDLKKGYKHPIVAKAVYEYFVNGVPPEETIDFCRDILDFCISQKVGREFQMELKALSGTQSLQKTNRFYISEYGGFLSKRHKDGRQIGLFVGKMVQLLNEYDHEKPFEDYLVDKAWYIKEAKKLIEEIEPSVRQGTMFDFNLTDFGKRVNFFGDEITKKKRTGSNPLGKQITEKEVREANRKKITYDVSPKYALVTSLDTKYSPSVTLYSLSRGTEKKFKIAKDVFQISPITFGDIISIEGFEKKPKYRKEGNGFVKVDGEHVLWITSYTKLDTVEDFKRKQ